MDSIHSMTILLILGSLLTAVILIRIFTGAMNLQTIEEESLANVEKKHPYLPKVGAVIASVVIVAILFGLSLAYGKATSFASFTGKASLIRTVLVFATILLFGFFDQVRYRGGRDRYKYFYGFVLGTIVSWILIAFKRAFFETGVGQDPFLMALGIVCIVLGYRFLFGPWNESIKVTVLGTFLFWCAYAILRFETAEELLATGIAAAVAIVPVIAWCWLFLRYHKERIAVVILAFFAGMLSTVPILFYSKLTEKAIEFNFFFFKIVPMSFGSSSKDFVSGSILGSDVGTYSIVLTTLVTYLLVGAIEEVSKFWVLRHSSREFFRSIDDVLQLSIIVALGFAFAENLVNPSYFVGFVREYILTPLSPQWGPFIASVIGRGVLTTMEHILSTGVLGYFFGLAYFASPVVRDRFQKGKFSPTLLMLHQMLALRPDALFARSRIVLGLVLAIALHGAFDFIVTLPEVLPGNPATVGALLGSSEQSILSNISITLLPSIFYVVGGFWLLSYLFERTEDMKEFGQIVETAVVVN